jgi:hypothetical protein
MDTCPADCQANDWTNAGDGHQSLAHRILAGMLPQKRIKLLLLLAHHIARLEQRSDRGPGLGQIGQQSFDLCREGASVHGADLPPIDLEIASDCLPTPRIYS